VGVPAVWWVIYRIAIRHEEAYLEQKFGSAYSDYKASVRRWL
jgi:protein-S-isoprenylcysteine O-methyltransferase Ste14